MDTRLATAQRTPRAENAGQMIRAARQLTDVVYEQPGLART